MSAPSILITGCNGLLGTAVGEALSSRYHLIGVDVTEPHEDSPMDEVHHMDVTSETSVRDVVDHVEQQHDGRLASVVHLAAYYDFSGEPSPLYDEITVDGTRTLLKALETLQLEQFLFTSTMLVHAPVEPGERIDEASPIDARWAYPESKVRTERVIRENAGDTPFVLLRLAGVYTGVGRQPTLVQQIRRIHTQDLESFLFPGDTEAGQALVHLDDAVEAVVRAVERRDRLPNGVAILVGEPDPPSYGELQDRIGELIWDAEWPTIRVPEKAAEVGAWLQDRVPGKDPFIKPFMIELADDHYGLDIGRARELLGWEPRHRLMETLPEIIRRLLEDPEAWYEANGAEIPDNLPERAETEA